MQAGQGLQKGVAQKQFDTGHERVQVAITRLTDLWQTLTRFRTEKDRSSTIVIFEPAEARQHKKNSFLRQYTATVIFLMNKKKGYSPLIPQSWRDPRFPALVGPSRVDICEKEATKH